MTPFAKTEELGTDELIHSHRAIRFPVTYSMLIQNILASVAVFTLRFQCRTNANSQV